MLGGLLPLAVAAGRRGVAPLVALLAVTASDTLAVGARVSNGHPGAAAQLLLIAGFCVLGCAPVAGRLVARGPGGCGASSPGPGCTPRPRSPRVSRGGWPRWC